MARSNPGVHPAEPRSGIYAVWGKRAFDVAAAAAALLVLSPLMLIVALAIRLQDGHASFFRQVRVGRFGRPFELIKFRSMPVNSGDVPSAQAASLIVTPLGKLLRRSNLDELPQLINILHGDLSLVGPRPALAVQAELLAMRTANGSMDCKPGLTGLAQVNAYDGMPEHEKADWDGKYAERIALATDLRIILRTFSYLIRKPPIY